MTTSAMNSDKISLTQAILSIDNPETLNMVKKQVYIILTKNQKLGDTPQQPNTYEELIERLNQSVADAKCGRVYASEEVHDSLEKEYPWLCD